MQCVIKWDIPIDHWQTYFEKIEKSNLLQSVPYLKAQRFHSAQKLRLGLILIDGKEAGIVGLLEVSLFWKMIHGVILDRGPLWFDGFGGAAHIKFFFDAFNKEFSDRFGRKRRIIPEMEDSPAASALLDQTGLKRLERAGYQTIWLDITKDHETLLAMMKKNWRGALNKAKRSHLDVQIDDNASGVSTLLNHYQKDKVQKEYDGPSPQLLQKIAEMMGHSKDCLILNAMQEGQVIAGILIFSHGKSATYQVGWSSEQGRTNNAHHFLLWQAINVLKERGIQHLDLGGINDETAKGVKQFKLGLGGQIVQLIGHYC